MSGAGVIGPRNDILLPYQAAWFEETAPVAVVDKGRRVGFTWTEAAACAMHAAEDRGNCFYQSFNQDMTRGFIAKAGDWLGRFEVAASIVESRTEPDPDRPGDRVLVHRIRLAAGRKIEALESSPRAIRSKGDPGDRYVLDEAAFVGPGVSLAAQAKHLAEVLKSALAVPMWGGQVRVISTHNGADNPFNELVQDAREGRIPWAHHHVTLDDAIAQGLVERINEVTGQRQTREEFRAACFAAYPDRESAEEELLCIPRRSAGVYLPRHLVESCMVEAPVLRFEGSDEFNAAPPHVREAETALWLEVEVAPALHGLRLDRQHVFGFDFARSGHMSVLAPLALDGPKRRCPFLLEMHNVPHAQQASAIAFVCRRLPRFAGGAMDATGAGDAVAEATVDEFGSLVEKVAFSLGWYREWMPRYKGLLEGEGIAIPRHDDVLLDHRAVELVNGVPKVRDAPGQRRHGDSVVALVLACQAAEAAHAPIGFDTTGPRVAAGADWKSGFLAGGAGAPGRATGMGGFI